MSSAKHYYLHQRLAEESPAILENLDCMLKPLIILYSVGTVGVLRLPLALVGGETIRTTNSISV